MLSSVGRAAVEEGAGGAAGLCEQIRSGQLQTGARRGQSDGVVCGVRCGVEWCGVVWCGVGSAASRW